VALPVAAEVAVMAREKDVDVMVGARVDGVVAA
jgi:hypothetical protein